MEKQNCYKGVLRIILTISVLANIFSVFGQTDKAKNFPIPDSINQVFQASCMPCHGSTGGRFPTSRLNFSRWEGYGAAKEAEKASMICSCLTRGSMPPSSVRKSNPELIPTDSQRSMICKWAESIKTLKKEKK